MDTEKMFGGVVRGSNTPKCDVILTSGGEAFKLSITKILSACGNLQVCLLRNVLSSKRETQNPIVGVCVIPISNMFERVLVAYDGSEPSEKALEVALDIATKYSSQLEIVRVVDTSAINSYLDVVPVELEKQMYDEARRDLERAELKAKRKLPNAKTTLLSGDPASEILEYSHKNGFGLLVCGNRGRSKLKRVLLGSVSSRFAHESRVPVLIIR